MRNNRMALYVVLGAIVFSVLQVEAGASSIGQADGGIAINQSSVLVYPPRMLYSAIYYGEARVVISIDENGKLTDFLVTGYTNEAFAQAAVGALKKWSYEPARVDGTARASRADVFFVFRDEGVIVHHLPGALEQHRTFGAYQDRYTFKPCRLGELDRIPTPLHVIPPVVAQGNRAHAVTVEFYIDTEGRVRMPAVALASADDIYAAAAVSAVEQWRFEPPLRKGRPVLVYAQQEFKFISNE